MIKVQPFLFGVFLICVSYSPVSAQNWEIGGVVSGVGYIGDLNPVNYIQPNNIGGGVFIRRNLDSNWSIRLNASYSRVSSADSLSNNLQQRKRNLSFFSPLLEVGVLSEFNFFKFSDDINSTIFTPFIFLGMGLSQFDPRTELDGTEYRLRGIRTEGQREPYSSIALNIPFGAGVKYKLRNNWRLGGELGYRIVFSDYLDDVGGRYPDFSGLSSDNIRVKLSNRSDQVIPFGIQRGDFKTRDAYFFISVTLSFVFNVYRCPDVK